MGLFDFVGTFFFLSLGITFVLILLLVYHFKQRLTEMEQKSDKMFEIINTIVKEMGNMRRAINQEAVSHNVHYVNENEYSNTNTREHCDANRNEACFEPVLENEEEEDEEEDPIIDTIEYEMGTQDDVNKFFKINHSHEEDSESESREEEVKVVSVDLTYHDEDIKVEDDQYISDLEDAENENENDTSDIQELHTTIGEELIHVNKLDESVVETETISPVDSVQQVPYSKMTLPQLRAFAVSRGLLSDSSKMKKADLIKLLEETNDNDNE